MNVTVLDVAKRFIGLKEIPGNKDNPFIVWCLSICGIADAHDEIPWCSAFVNGIAFILGLPRSGLASARSWLRIGISIDITDAIPGNDVVIFKRGTGVQPGPEVINAPGHIALFLSLEGDYVWVIGGNQGNTVSKAKFPVINVLGVRRLIPNE